MPAWATLLTRLLMGLGLVGLGWWTGGASSAMAAVGIAGLLLARPLIDVAGELRQWLRARAWGDLQGRHMSWQGRRLTVREDVAHRRWVRVADLRAIVGPGSSDGALALSYPAGFERHGGEAWLADEAVLLHLARTPGTTAARLRQWVEREVAFPARRTRERLGIRVPAPEAASPD